MYGVLGMHNSVWKMVHHLYYVHLYCHRELYSTCAGELAPIMIKFSNIFLAKQICCSLDTKQGTLRTCRKNMQDDRTDRQMSSNSFLKGNSCIATMQEFAAMCFLSLGRRHITNQHEIGTHALCFHGSSITSRKQQSLQLW